MNKWYQSFYKETGLTPYIWLVFCILPFYFILAEGSTPLKIGIGIGLIVLFFIGYVLSLITKTWMTYIWISLQIVISATLIVFYGYVYFSIFLAFFIGNVKHKGGFYSLYIIHLITAFVTINIGFFSEKQLFYNQFPFILISLIVTILLPINTYSVRKQETLEVELEDANKRISELVKLEERQRIARDLHDTVGQKLSLISLKADLAAKLLQKDIYKAEAELKEIRATSSTALKEVRELVTKMRGIRLCDEIVEVSKMLEAAQIEYTVSGTTDVIGLPLLSENVLSMCLKEAVTNIVKHSQANHCQIWVEVLPDEVVLSISDNGVGIDKSDTTRRGNGLKGMQERVEFVNGTLLIRDAKPNGTLLIIKVPRAVKQPTKEGIN